MERYEIVIKTIEADPKNYIRYEMSLYEIHKKYRPRPNKYYVIPDF